MIEQGLFFYVIIVMVMVILLAATISIPFYGLIKKRLKGLAIGCFLQPFVCALICLLTAVGVYFYQRNELQKYRGGAMVTLRKTDADGKAHFWYLKANEECFYERWNGDEEPEFDGNGKMSLYDVVPLDSFKVCVDDVIFVKFDLEKHEVTAKEYDEPLDIVNVDWNKVKAFFQSHP
jgi:hypothetical protein